MASVERVAFLGMGIMGSRTAASLARAGFELRGWSRTRARAVARAAGVDFDALVRAVAASSGASTMLELKAAPMREHDFEPLFRLGHTLEDVRLALGTAGT